MTPFDYNVPQRVRFAPSPTGSQHVGGARTALFNYLLARRTGGAFVLRVEDTDVERNRAGAEEALYDALRWLGLTWQEGPDAGGQFGPYRQSERTNIYREHADRLREMGSAYEDEGALRFRIPSGKTLVEDLVKGNVTFENVTLTDPVIIKSNGGPTYNFAAAIDDALMGITLVLRGDEHLPNTPVQLAIQSALGLRSPRYAHVPLILNEHHQKLSKRHDTVSIEEFRELGVLPEAMIDHLALLGWSSPDGREEFTLEELAKVFSLERIQKAGAIFNEARLLAFNARALRKLPRERKIATISEALRRWGYAESAPWVEAFVDAYFDELQTIEQARPIVAALHADDVDISEVDREALGKPAVRQFLGAFSERGTDPKTIPALAAEFGLEKKDAFHAVRIALTGAERGAPLVSLLPLLGPARVAARLRASGGGNRSAPSAR